ncbi:MAG: amidohydrolase, partial [Acidobacteriota bacterium]
FSVRSALAIGGGRILGAGSDEEINRFRGPETRVVDLGGKTVLPGLIDSHSHPAGASVIEFDHEIPSMQTIEEVLSYIKQRVAVSKPGDWIWVKQVFLTRLKEQRYPTREELDRVAPENPVVFRTGPDASVNSLALKLAGIDEDWKVDDGGTGFAEKDPETGKLTGILRNCSRYLTPESGLKSPTREDRKASLRKLFADYNRVGITAVAERDASRNEVELYTSMHQNGELSVRSYLSLHIDSIQPIEEIRARVQSVAKGDLYSGDSMLRMAAVKAYLDGGMLTGSAYMLDPWGTSQLYGITDPEYRGIQFIPDEKLVEILRICFENNVQFMAHSVGDGAVDAFIRACETLEGDFDIRQQRPVICHSNFMAPDAIERVARLGITADIQPSWLFLDGRTLVGHFGIERMSRFQPLRQLFAAGAIAGGGSDHMQKIGSLRSINFYDPWKAIWVTMTRRAHWLDQPIRPENALSRVEAIRFFTINNAYLLQAEKEYGSLEAGKLADFIVISNDILTCPVDEIPNTKVLSTYVGGNLVFEQKADR